MQALVLFFLLTAAGSRAEGARDEDARRGLQTPAPGVSAPTPASVRASQSAVEAGLAYLVTLQERAGDGSFAVHDVGPSEYAPLGVTALATLAFLASGSAPERGPHGPVVGRALEYLLRHVDLGEGSREHGYISAQGDKASNTHGHGYATLVLAEVYGMSRGSERVRVALEAAVARIERSQGAEGGWHYKPHATAEHEGSVTICMVQALRAARDAGLRIDPEVVRRAEDYVRRLQAPNGLFCYTLGDEKRASVALTGAAIATLNATGRYDEGILQDGVDAIWSALALREDQGGEADFPEYERLYVAQAFWQLSDTSHFQRWFERERERLLRSQEADGGWHDSRFGSAYATAVNCLVLSLPDATLPIFQR